MVLPLTGLLIKHIIDYPFDYQHLFGKSLKTKTKCTFCSRQRVLTLRCLYRDKAFPKHHRDFECEQIPISEQICLSYKPLVY